MKKPAPRRGQVQLTRKQLAQLQQDRKAIAGELPALIAKQQNLRTAAGESSASGALRRAIHASEILLHDLAKRASTDLKTLDAFLLGEQPLSSDVFDRLAQILNLTLARVNGSPVHQVETEWNGDRYFFEGSGLSSDDPEFKRRERRGPNAPRAVKKRSGKKPKK